MKTTFVSVALVASAAMIAQANPGVCHASGGGVRGGAVAHRAPAGHAPVRAGGFSSFHSMPARSFAGGMTYPRQRYSSFGMRSYRPTAFRQPSVYPNGVTITRSGPYTAATTGQPSRTTRFQIYQTSRSSATKNESK